MLQESALQLMCNLVVLTIELGYALTERQWTTGLVPLCFCWLNCSHSSAQSLRGKQICQPP